MAKAEKKHTVVHAYHTEQILKKVMQSVISVCIKRIKLHVLLSDVKGHLQSTVIIPLGDTSSYCLLSKHKDSVKLVIIAAGMHCCLL